MTVNFGCKFCQNKEDENFLNFEFKRPSLSDLKLKPNTQNMDSNTKFSDNLEIIEYPFNNKEITDDIINSFYSIKDGNYNYNNYNTLMLDNKVGNEIFIQIHPDKILSTRSAQGISIKKRTKNNKKLLDKDLGKSASEKRNYLKNNQQNFSGKSYSIENDMGNIGIKFPSPDIYLPLKKKDNCNNKTKIKLSKKKNYSNVTENQKNGNNLNDKKTFGELKQVKTKKGKIAKKQILSLSKILNSKNNLKEKNKNLRGHKTFQNITLYLKRKNDDYLKDSSKITDIKFMTSTSRIKKNPFLSNL